MRDAQGNRIAGHISAEDRARLRRERRERRRERAEDKPRPSREPVVEFRETRPPLLRPPLMLGAIGLLLVVLFAVIPATTSSVKRTAWDPSIPRRNLYLGVLKIDAYVRLNGHTPADAAIANLGAKGPYVYNRIDDRHYTLTYREKSGIALTYDSHEPLTSYFGTPSEMLGGLGKQP